MSLYINQTVNEALYVASILEYNARGCKLFPTNGSLLSSEASREITVGEILRTISKPRTISLKASFFMTFQAVILPIASLS